MKGRRWKQILGLILVATIVLGDSSFVFAAETVQKTTSVVETDDEIMEENSEEVLVTTETNALEGKNSEEVKELSLAEEFSENIVNEHEFYDDILHEDVENSAFDNCLESNEKENVTETVRKEEAIAETTFYATTEVEEVISGSCGENLAWELKDGVLTISGTGTMEDYPSQEGAPWYSYKDSIKSLVISEDVTGLGGNAFADCYFLKEIYFNATAIENVGQNVFWQAGYESSGITMTVGNNVTKIPDFMFNWDGSNLVKVVFEEGSVCESIGVDTFNKCANLKEIIIPDSVTSIGNYAFFDCYNLLIQTEKKELPETLGLYWHYGAALCTDAVEFGTTDYGQSYWISSDNTAHVWKYNGKNSIVEIPKEINGVPVMEIASSAFYDCSNIKEVLIPETVTTIGSHAFYKCINLERIAIPKAIVNIGDEAFSECKSVSEILFNAEQMVDLQSSNEVFGNVGFYSKEVRVVVGNSVTRIPSYLFSPYVQHYEDAYGVPYITEVKFEDNSVCTAIGANAFSGCSLIENITLPESINTIEAYAFSGCSLIENITIPQNTKLIEEYAFSDCSSLIRINYNAAEMETSSYYDWTDIFANAGSTGEGVTVIIGKNVKMIPDGVFGAPVERCNKIVEVIFEENSQCTSIASGAFYDCKYLTSIKIPENITEFGGGAFEGCISLKTAGPSGSGCNIEFSWQSAVPASAFSGSSLVAVALPDTISTIGCYALAGCDALAEITIPQSIKTIGEGAFQRCSGLKEIFFNATMMEDLEEYNGIFAESGDNGIRVTIGANVTKIPAYLFDDDGWSEHVPNITEVVFEDGGVCETIGTRAFKELSGISRVNIPESVTRIGEYAFYGCSGMVELTLSENLTAIEKYTFYNCSNLEELIIPEKVTDIGEYAFSDCSSLRELTIPADIAVIENCAFSSCKGVEKFNYNAIEPEVAANAFSNLGTEGEGVTVFIGNKVKYIPDSFLDASGDKIKKLYFENKSVCERIGAEAFKGCTGLLNFTLPRSVVTIGEEAFYGCTKLSSISVKNVGKRAFFGCTNLVHVTIREGATRIGENAFSYSNLEYIIIPISLSEIGNFAFDDIQTVYYGGTEEEWEEFDGSSLEIPSSAEIIYSSNGPKYDVDKDENEENEKSKFSQSVKFFSNWDEDSNIAYFGLLDYEVTEQTDSMFMEIANDLVGQYVLVQEILEYDDSGNMKSRILQNVLPVDAYVGTVSNVSEEGIVIDGNTYSMSGDGPIFSLGDDVLYFLCGDTIVWIEILKEKTGIIKYWNASTRELSLSSDISSVFMNTYYLSELADKESVSGLGWTGHCSGCVKYIVDSNGFVYHIESNTPPEDNYSNFYDTYVPMSEDEKVFYDLSTEWKNAYEELVKAVDNAMKAFAGSDKETRERSISKRAKAMQENDQSSYSKYLSGKLGPYAEEAYHALATFLYDHACENAEFVSVDLSNSMASTTIVNNILSAMWGETKEYPYENVTISITAMGYGKSSSFGKMDILFELENGERGVYSRDIIICSSQADCETAVAAYVEELSGLASNAAYNVATSVYKDILGKSLSSLTKEYVSGAVAKIEKKLAVDLTEKFKLAGVGNIIHTLDECYTYYDNIYKPLNAGDLDDFLTVMPYVLDLNLEFKDKTIKDAATNKAMAVIKKIVKKIKNEYDEYLKDLGTQDKTVHGKYQINCPVDVKVYDSRGEQIGYIGLDDIWYSEDIRITENGGSKQILSYTDDKLAFEMVAREFGTMDCSFEEYDEDGNILGRLNYYNISLSPEQTFEISLTDDLKSNANSLAIMTNEKQIFANEYISVSDSAGISIKVNIEGKGEVTGIGNYVCGDAVVLNVIPEEGYKFIGWYKNDVLVSASNIYEFTATEDVYLYAKFYQDDSVYVSVDSNVGGNVIGSGRYNNGDVATVIAIPEEHYIFNGWYSNDQFVSSDMEYQFSVVENMELFAKFEKSEEIANNGYVTRISGDTRYETGYKVADTLKEKLGVDTFDAVVIATGKNFADALSGSYLAVVKNAPILLTNGKSDNIASLHNYIRENVTPGGTVYILGGEAAVPDTVETIDDYDVVRLSGNSRYDTNLEILKAAGITGDELIIATGKSFADSLSASAAKLPILLVKPGDSLNDAQKAILDDMSKIHIIGGEGAVSKTYEAELKAYGTVERVFGNSRYETSVAVANTFFKDVNEVVVASGKNFPDGLCGGPLAAAMNAPLILTADGKTDAAAEYVKEGEVNSGFILGGVGAIGDDSVVDVFELKNADEILSK